MTPEVLSTLIICCAAVLLAFASVVVVRGGNARPEMLARISQLEARADAFDRSTKEACEAASAAKRIASRRKDKEEREELRAPRRGPPPPTELVEDEGFSLLTGAEQEVEQLEQELNGRG